MTKHRELLKKWLNIIRKSYSEDVVLLEQETSAIIESHKEEEIISVLPKEYRELAFRLAYQQTHCQNFEEWLIYLENYVKGFSYIMHEVV
jgi:hypothetical protein